MTPKHQRYAARLRALIKEGEVLLVNLKPPSSYDGSRHTESATTAEWRTKVANVLAVVFTTTGTHWAEWVALREGRDTHDHKIRNICGFLRGALDDLEQGYLTRQEFLIAGEVFSDLLDQAEHVLKAGYRPCAAVLMRVVIEDALRRLAVQGDIDPDQSIGQLNDALRKAGQYGKPQWRSLQSWIDMGSDNAHGDFDSVTDDEVRLALQGVREFLIRELASA